MGFKAGLVALVGKPNVGKSTLVNALVGRKVSIVSDKPQTTRRRALGVAQGEGFQIGLFDTPGLHEPTTILGKAMNEQARAVLAEVDVIVAVVDCSREPDELDQGLGELLREQGHRIAPIIVCLNKMDRLSPDKVVSRVERFTGLFGSDRFMFTTAVRAVNVDKLLTMILELVPEGDPRFAEDEFTDQPARFMTAELIREQVLSSTRQEVPYSTAVRIDRWQEADGLLSIAATIFVERAGQKAIVIGKRGAMIKQIGTKAREQIEELLGRHVFLDLHVSVKEGWRQSASLLSDLEYT
jgi:GTP-binding protein Era